jgi:two-component system phosphate regulon sensor histidine kinase PhoR
MLQRRFAAWYALLTVAGWVVLAAAAVVAAPAPESVVTVVAVATTGAVAVAGALLVGHTVTRPIERLTQAARRLAAGAGYETIPAAGQDEISELARAFNEMAHRLRFEMAALTAERNQATAVLANMADGIVIVDRALRVQRVNPAAARLLGLRDPAEPAAGGRSLAAVVRDHEVQQILTAALAQGAARSAVVRLGARGDGAAHEVRDEPRFVRVTGIPIPADELSGAAAGLLVLQDVTAIRRAETIRREFVANVSHELRTPLASLRALVETLEEGALDDPPAAREFLALMHVEVDSLTHLVQELLELSRIESGHVSLRPKAVAPAELAEEVVRRLRRQAERAGLDLALDAPADLAPVPADAARIVQAVINLVQNAIKFTPAGGRVVVRVRRDADGIRFEVADTGVGVAPEDLPRLFERFYKADRSRASGGTGLGLAITKHIVQLHGGRIWAESPGEGRGATFAFTLPLAEAAGLNAGAAPAAALQTA